jgi:hypothetical protein
MANPLVQSIRRLIDGPTLNLFSKPLASRGMDFLQYQHQRARRRVVEKRLKETGVYGDVVQKGPFKGFKYPSEGYISCRFQKVIGTYEHELHSLVSYLAANRRYTHIINVGAADGYYAVGLALAFPESKTVAFEMHDPSRATLTKVAKLNGVENRFDIRGACDPQALIALESEINPETTLVVCDVDGYEIELLVKGGVSWLNKADILIELHDCLRSGVTDQVQRFFAPTHHLTKITNAGVDYKQYPILRDLLFREINDLVNEDRKGLQDWFFMTPDAALHQQVMQLPGSYVA